MRSSPAPVLLIATASTALEKAFAEHGFAVLRARTAEEASGVAATAAIAILDVPDAARALGRLAGHVPVIVLAGAEADAPALLDAGADDVLAKPFSHRELVARAKAIVRRTSSDAAPIVAGTLRIEPHRLLVGGRAVSLSPSELALLRELARSPGRAFTRAELLAVVSGEHVGPRVVDTHLARVRRKLGRAGDCIETIRRYGYRFREG